MPHRLIDSKLKFGHLIQVTAPHLRERYNRALGILTGRTTTLPGFSIDMLGWSPEIAKEFCDPNYLNIHGANQKFILLDVAQRHLPAVRAEFSSMRAMFRQFVEDNLDQLLVLTAKDVVIGEMDDNTWRIEHPDDLFSIKRIHFLIETSRGLVAKAERLRRDIDTYGGRPDGWIDETLLERIAGLAEEVGDIRRSPVQPTTTTYQKRSFHTKHFGGIYVFNDGETITAIGGDTAFQERLDGCRTKVRHIPLTDRASILDFLVEIDAIETVAETLSRPDAAEMIRLRLEQIVAHFVIEDGAEIDPDAYTDLAMRQYTYPILDRLPAEFHSLSMVQKALAQGVSPLEIEPGIDDDTIWYLIRSRGHSNKDLVNQLIAHQAPLDFLTAYVMNKDMFFERYARWIHAMRDFAVGYLQRVYLNDKPHMREMLHGTAPVTGAAPGQASPWQSIRQPIFASPADPQAIARDMLTQPKPRAAAGAD